MESISVLAQRQIRRSWRFSSLLGSLLVLAALLGGRMSVVAQPQAAQKLLYVALDNAIQVYDINNGHVLAKIIKLPGYAHTRGIQASAARHLLYVSYLDTPLKGSGLVAIDLISDKIVWTKLYPGADAVSITPDSATIFMSSGEKSVSNYFYVIDAATGAERGRIPVFPQTHNGLVNVSGDRAYLASKAYRYLVAADTTTFQPVKQIGPFGDAIRPFTVNGRGTLAFVNVNHLQGFEVGDLRTGTVLYRVVIPGAPNKLIDPSHGIGMTPDEQEIWVSGETNDVYIFDATQMPPQQIGSVRLGQTPKWISMSIDGRYIYPGSGDVVDRASRKVVAHYPATKRQLEVDFAGGIPVQAGDMYAKGQVTGAEAATPSATATSTATSSATSTSVATPTMTTTSTGVATPAATITPTTIATPARANDTQQILLPLVQP